MKRALDDTRVALKRVRPPPPREDTVFTERHALLKRATLHFATEAEIERARNYPALMGRLYLDEFYNPAQFTGDRVIRAIEQSWQYFFPQDRFPFQKKLHNYLLRATLHQTLGVKFDSLCNEVCRRYGWRGPTKNLFAIASRRSGKTTATASAIAAFLLHVPNIMIVVFSVAKRSASEFVQLVVKYIHMYPGGSERILHNSQSGENLEIRGLNQGDTRRVRSFPAGGKADVVRSKVCVCARVCVG